MPVFALIYLALSIIVAYVGRRRKIGFAGFFVLSLVLTPLVMILVYLLGAPRAQKIDSTKS